MIEKIKIRNFLSFKNEIVFSFEASKDSFAEGSQVVRINEDVRLLRFGVVYGYNASGKSNLLKAFEFLHGFWFDKHDSVDEPIDIAPFKLDEESPRMPSGFELFFWVDGVRYKYQLELDRAQVYKETLFCYKTSRPTTLFDRHLDGEQSIIKFNTEVLGTDQEAEKAITLACLNNTSVFVARSTVNTSIPLIDAARNWMKNHMMRGISPATSLVSFAQRRCADDGLLSQYLLSFLREADFNITGISVEKDEKPLPPLLVDMVSHATTIPQDMKNLFAENRLATQHRTVVEHTVDGGKTYRLMATDENDGEESRGTMRTFGLESALYTAIKGDSFLTIDEIETSLHPKLLEKILFEYLRAESKSQLIVTTHNDGLLDLVGDLLRKDSVWFTEKNGAGVTDLYKLTDFRGVNRLSSIREAYRNKRFGATMN